MIDNDNSQSPQDDDTSLKRPRSGDTQSWQTKPKRSLGFPFGASTSRSSAANTSGLAGSIIKRKRHHLLLLIALALLILGGGLWYVYWFQNPNKVVSDALLHAAEARSMRYDGTFTSTGSTKTSITLTGGLKDAGATADVKMNYEAGGRKYTLNGNALVDEKNNLYFKLKNIDELAANYRRAIPAASQGLFDQVIDTMDDKWVRVGSEELKGLSPGLIRTQECYKVAIGKIQEDAALRSEIKDTYKKHPFIAIDATLGAKDGSLGYVLKTEKETAKRFDEALKKTAFYEALIKCDRSFAEKRGDQLLSGVSLFGDNVTTQLWVDRWTHQISKVIVKQESRGQKTEFSLAPKFNRPVAIELPKQTTTLKKLQNDIQQLLLSAQPARTTDTQVPQN